MGIGNSRYNPMAGGKWRSAGDAREQGEIRGDDASRMRICVVYDCLFPYTVGGAERWYRNLAERLLREGHEVTYLTLRQWDRGERADLDPRIRVVAAGPRMALYTAGGRRRILPAARFRPGRPAPPAALWPALRRRPHRVPSPTSRCSPPALARPLVRLRAGRRLVRGVERLLLARLPRRGRPGASGRWSSASARGSPSGPTASPSCTPSGCARRGCGAR